MRELRELRGIEESENPMIFEELKEFGDFGDMVRSSELRRKQRVTPQLSHATIAEGSADNSFHETTLSRTNTIVDPF